MALVSYVVRQQQVKGQRKNRKFELGMKKVKNILPVVWIIKARDRSDFAAVYLFNVSSGDCVVHALDNNIDYVSNDYYVLMICNNHALLKKQCSKCKQRFLCWTQK
jgi:hypothetical protein